MNRPRTLLVFCLLALVKENHGASNACTDRKAKSCAECMEVAGCGWCQDPTYDDNPNIIVSRCEMPENLAQGEGKCKSIINPPSKIVPIVDEDHSSVGESDVGKATQLRPQVVSAQLRPGAPSMIEVSYKQAEDYPVDLYYLLDLSSSMQDDLKSLRKLGKKLGDTMGNITKNFRLGFGSFVDKTVMPFISTVPAKLLNPCLPTSSCVPAYSFHNDLPLSLEINDFVDKVNKVNHSSNLDSPEGGFDAMMQAIVCTNEIKWRNESTHLLVYVTDAVFHYAGDGKLGGIVAPNDGKCYLDSTGNYYKANEMDYPSIGHLVEKISANRIQPIFAVTKEVYNTYEKLQDLIPKSTVGELSSDSNNIIDLIEKAYNDLLGQVVLEVDVPEGVEVVSQTSHCTSGDTEGLSCDGLKIGDVVNFTLSIKANKCFDETKKMKITVYGYNDMTEIDLSTLCDCQCDGNVTAPASNCSGNGHFDCGACVCDPGYLGFDCSCDKKDISSAEAYLKNCTNPNTDAGTDVVVCSGRGQCLCGQCLCWQYPGRKIDGTYCECDDTSCDRINTKMCNGHGQCDCGKCKCDAGWSGDGCECTADKSTCLDPDSDSKLHCNGAGLCECGECECNVTKTGFKYRGQYCQISPQQLCDLHKTCVQCIAYGNRDLYDKNPTMCDAECSQYAVRMLDGKASVLRDSCRAVDNVTDCQYTFWYETKGDVILIDTDPETKVCRGYIDTKYIIIGIIAAIVGIGLAILLIWKLLTSIKDAREYKQWEKEVQTAKWETGGNPIFKSATSKFTNPTYRSGKPSSEL